MTLRELFVDWLTASRYIRWLEARHHEQRQDYTERLAEKDTQIKQLRAEIAALKLERSTLWQSVTGVNITPSQPALVVPEFAGPDDWQAELNRLYEQEKANGTHGTGREEVHEPSPDDGA